MKQDKITSLQYATLTFFLMNSFLLNIGFSSLTNSSGVDAIFDILIGSGFLLLWGFFLFQIHHRETLNIIDYMDTQYSTVIKWLLFILLLIIIGITGIFSLSNLVNFIHYYILKEGNSILIAITITATVLYIVSKELSSIGKVSELFFYVYIFLFALGMIGLMKYFHLDNLKPFLISPIKKHIVTTSIYLSSSIIPLFLILIVPQKKIQWSKKKKPYPFLLLTISIVLMLVQLLIIIGVLGISLTNIFQYPDMIALKKISFLNLIERVEVLLSFNQVLNGLFIFIMSTYFIKELLHKFLKKKKEPVTLALIGFLMIWISNSISISQNVYQFLNLILALLLILLGVHYFFHKYNHYS